MRWRPNVVVAAIAEDQGRFLLVEERIRGQLVYNQPAGHLEQGEDLLEAVKREVLEETAWEFIPTALVGVYLYPATRDQGVTFLRFCFHGQCVRQHPERALDKGIVRAVWLDIDAIREQEQKLRSPMVARCIEDYMAGRLYPLESIKGVI